MYLFEQIHALVLISKCKAYHLFIFIYLFIFYIFKYFNLYISVFTYLMHFFIRVATWLRLHSYIFIYVNKRAWLRLSTKECRSFSLKNAHHQHHPTAAAGGGGGGEHPSWFCIKSALYINKHRAFTDPTVNTTH